MDDAKDGAPPRLERVKPVVPGMGGGLGAPVVTAVAALAAGLPYEGALDQDSVLRLWYLAAATQASGRLQLETDRGRFALHFKRGVVEHVASNLPEDDIGQFLIARRVVSAEAVGDARKLMGDQGGDLVAVLTQLRLINPAECFQKLQEHGVALVGQVISTARGIALWNPTASAPMSSFPLGSRWGLFCDAVRKLDGLTVRMLLGDRGQRIARRTGGRIEAAELRLTAQEARAAALFDGRASPAQLASAWPASAEALWRVALLYGETELLEFTAPTEVASAAAIEPTPAPPLHAEAPPRGAPSDAREAKAPVTARAPSKSAAPVHAAGGASGHTAGHGGHPVAQRPVAPTAPHEREVPVDVGSLRAFLDKIARADHFEALGVGKEATGSQIKATYFRLARIYHPDAGSADEAPEVKTLRADIFARLNDAWGTLGDDAKRAAYLQELATGGKPEVDVGAIFRAEELFQKAVACVRSRQYQRGLEALGEAKKLNDEPEYDVWKAYCEFLIAGDPKRQYLGCAAAIEAALAKLPRCMPGYLFLGQMGKMAEQFDAAERHLRRGLVLDPNNVELSRELKYLRKGSS